MGNDKKALNGWNNIDILLELFVLLLFYIHATRKRKSIKLTLHKLIQNVLHNGGLFMPGVHKAASSSDLAATGKLMDFSDRKLISVPDCKA
ncbi:hypothetical protein CK203_030670 [Vitis vinifera]|uniref:Uncharacterized protein n=1 Tax=Vitis vinifera TaxID=29760 RepID=A0A438IRE6_VITVI|nr:hypothetical protein CK203_030670 [Vitis vinifera]